MARKKRHEEHENLERWLISYADFITLLFAFFVVMYAISSVNEGKYRVLADTLTDAFHNTPRTLKPIQVGEEGIAGEPTLSEDERLGTDPIDIPTEGKADESNLGQIADDFTQAMQSLIDQDLININRDKNWVEVEINTSLLFTSGNAELEDEALPILRRLAGILKKYPNRIQVEGFTDNLPINTYLFPSNWELSAARAASVVHVFTQNRVNPQRMAAIGYGEFRPKADNATAEGRRKNRRVVLVINTNLDNRRVLDRGAAAGG